MRLNKLVIIYKMVEYFEPERLLYGGKHLAYTAFCLIEN